MILLSETDKGKIVSGLKNISFLHNGSGYHLTGIRSGEDIPRADRFFTVSFIPINRKIGVGLDHWFSVASNPNYNIYEYGEEEQMVVRVFAKDASEAKGRLMSDSWMRQIETYLKANWNTLSISGGIGRSSFSQYKDLPNWFPKKMYGKEMSCTIETTNRWTNMPDSGAVSPVYVSGMEFSLSGMSVHLYI